MIEVNESQNPWFTKDRSESASFRMPDKTFNNIKVSNPGLGLNIYNNAISKENCEKYLNILENNLNGQTRYKWHEAKVTNSNEPVKYARNCSDFKYNLYSLGARDEQNAELIDMYEEIYNALKLCVDDYARYWGINVVYYEAFNFVKYEGVGQQFRIHADHGPAYNTTVSVVIYLNDDYEGGELFFPRLDNLVYKPKFGDIAIFPSNYIYEHASMDMVNGTKYCIVIMTDINELGHAYTYTERPQ
jgi:hypothetical protein